MSTIAQEIIRLQNAKEDLKSAIETKGVAVDSATTIDSYPTYVGEIVNSWLETIDASEFSGTSFSLQKLIKKADIPEGFTNINQDAFKDAINLTDVSIPRSVDYLANKSFYNCPKLSGITFNGSLRTFGDDCFYGCTSLTSMTVPSGITLLGEECFRGCTNLRSIDIPNTIQTIGRYCFHSNPSLTSVTIHADTPPSIGTYTLVGSDNCNYYVPCQSVAAYKAATNWSAYADRIYGIAPCYEPIYRTLTTATTCVGYDKYELDEYQVSYDSGETWSTTATSATTLIEANSEYCGYIPPAQMFKLKANYSDGTSYSAGCDSSSDLTTATTTAHSTSHTAMTDAEIGSCVTGISSNAFNGFSSLSSVTIPNTVTTIWGGAFGYTKLIDVTIPNSVTSIRSEAFKSISTLTSITVSDNVSSLSDYAVFGYNTNLENVQLPNNLSGALGAALFASCGKLSNISIPSGVTSIGSNCFSYCYQIPSIEIPSGVTSIGDNAFYYCSSLTSLTIPSGVTSIGNVAFQFCNNLSSITILATTPPTLGNSAFNNTNDCPIYVPSESVETYKSSNNWSAYASRIQAIQ